jgi:hypothetical protein
LGLPHRLGLGWLVYLRDQVFKIKGYRRRNLGRK